MKSFLMSLALLCVSFGVSFAQDAAQDSLLGEAVPEATVSGEGVVDSMPKDEPLIGYTAVAVEEASTPTETPAPVELTGTLIDNLCAKANMDNLTEMVKTHTKECAVKPECAASGYSFYSAGVLYSLDDESNAKVAEFLKGPESRLDVSVEGQLVNGKLRISSVKN